MIQDERLRLQRHEETDVEIIATEAGFSLKEEVGDLFMCDADACLAHCVSQDLRMGKGIAVLFKKRFGQVAELKAQQAKIGECAILHRGDEGGSSAVYYMVTKERYFHKPTYESVNAALESVRNHMVGRSFTKLCIPRIGCGLDGLEWNTVKDMIVRVFGETGISVTVYRLEERKRS